MMRILLLLVGLGFTSGDEGCTITAKSCTNFPQFRQSQFRDAAGESHLRTGSNEAACLKRAEDFHHWCGNSAEAGMQVAATYNPSHASQIYHPQACDKGWSQYNSHCYKHFWEQRSWYQAEASCQSQGDDCHLASIHSKAENQFIFSLSLGLSAWIGYVETEKESFQWSDDSQDDFENLAKNCTGREHEPDCKPEERAQQWYNHFQGEEVATYICKKGAHHALPLMRNVTAADLLVTDWQLILQSQEEANATEISTSPTEVADEPAIKIESDLCKDSSPLPAVTNTTRVEEQNTCHIIDMAAEVAKENAADQVAALHHELAQLRTDADAARSEAAEALEEKAKMQDELEKFRNESNAKMQELHEQVTAERARQSEGLSSLMSALLSSDLNITVVSSAATADAQNVSDALSSENATTCCNHNDEADQQVLPQPRYLPSSFSFF